MLNPKRFKISYVIFLFPFVHLVRVLVVVLSAFEALLVLCAASIQQHIMHKFYEKGVWNKTFHLPIHHHGDCLWGKGMGQLSRVVPYTIPHRAGHTPLIPFHRTVKDGEWLKHLLPHFVDL